MTIEQELSRLNEYQKNAVLNDSKACLLNACVGSGKTTVLVSKVQYLHEVKAIPLEKMMILTFTNKAANEIMERLHKEEEPLIGTFHSVALWLLRHKLSLEECGFTKDFLVIEPDEELDIAMMLIAEHKLNIKYKNRLKKRLEKAMTIQDETKKVSRYQDDIFLLVSMLSEEKKRQNKMSFYDLLYYCELLQSKRDEYPSFIIVDEVQDCDQNQLEFIKAFMGEDTHLFAVGDPNQVIYSWRGGDLNVFYRMKHMFQAEELHLPINYRSSSSILEAARCFLQNGDALEGSREQGTKITIKKQYDAFQDANYIVDRIRKLHEEGLPYHEIAVFYRLQSQAENFTKVFDREGIPYKISQKKTIRDIPVLNWLLRLLHVCINPKDKTSLLLALTDKEFGCGMTDAKARKCIKEQKNLPVLYTKMMYFQEPEVIDRFLGCNPQDEFIRYFELKNYLHPTSSEYGERLQYVEQFLAIMFTYIENKQESIDLDALSNDKKVTLFLGDMLEFLNSTALQGMTMSENDKDSKQDDYVNLMTLHASKGLEFSMVFITGVNYGWIPMQSKDEKDEEEERRLFFVGITRAKDQLELSYYINPGATRVVSGPSRYVEMIPKRLIESEDLYTAEASNPSEQTDIFKIQNLRKQVQLEQMKKKLASSMIGVVLGSKKKVRHEKYGIGEVIKEDDMMITVSFEGYGEKEFVKMLTKLEEI